MNRKDRPIPFKWGTQAYRDEYARLRTAGYGDYVARFEIRHANRVARLQPMKGERCGAKTRAGGLCQAKAMSNGKCYLHGSSRGAVTIEGKLRSLQNLKQNRK